MHSTVPIADQDTEGPAGGPERRSPNGDTGLGEWGLLGPSLAAIFSRPRGFGWPWYGGLVWLALLLCHTGGL